jgi:hypothetical protein
MTIQKFDKTHDLVMLERRLKLPNILRDCKVWNHLLLAITYNRLGMPKVDIRWLTRTQTPFQNTVQGPCF